MSLISSGATAGVSAGIYEAYDDLGVSASAVNTHQFGAFGPTADNFWATILGAGHGWNTPTNEGGVRARSSTGAGVGARTAHIDWRLGQRWSTSPGALTAVLRQRKFTFQCAVRVTADGPEIGIKQDPNLFTVANTILGYGLRSTGGNWVGVRRLTTGVVEAAVPVLQVFSSTVWRKLRMEFTEGPNPLIEFFMNDALMFSRSGEANMPELTAVNATVYAPAVSSAGGATIFSRDAMLRMVYL